MLHLSTLVGGTLMCGFLAGLTIPLSSCEQTPSPTVLYRCPPLQQYTPAQQTAALGELKAADAKGKLPQTHQMLTDYNTLRDACRAQSYSSASGTSN